MGLFDLFRKKVAPTLPPTVNSTKEITMSNFTFTSREEYVAYRTDWKARYAAQRLAIRKAKEDFKQTNRVYSKAELEYMANKEKTKDQQLRLNKQNAHIHLDDARWEFRNAKNEATELLAERAKSKIEAGRQRELRLKKVA